MFPVSDVPVALALTGYLSYFVPQVARGVGATLCTIAITWLFIGANWLGAKFVARVSGWTLLVGLIPVLVVAIGGWLIFKSSIFLASWNMSGGSALGIVPQATLIAFWAFTASKML